MEMRVRPTGILLENDRILLVKQYVTDTRGWSLPGGRLEADETIEQCLIRETKEETGLDIKVKELLYITDRFFGSDIHIVHMTFLVERAGEKTTELEWKHNDPNPTKSSRKLREIKMVPVDELTDYGFSQTFQQMVKADFPERGNYKGDFYTFYGETRPDERR
jgi:8-oxo-dGTP pyrophosphatase MutT (NUDIX family)